jgi:ribonuclease HI
LTDRLKYTCSLAKTNRNVNGNIVEVSPNWLDKISPWKWYNIECVKYSQRIFELFDYQIFVDGSMKNYNIGGAYLIKNIDSCNEYKFRLPNYSSVFEAEIYSIYLALFKLDEIKVEECSIIIVFDNFGVIQAINNYFNQQIIQLNVRKMIYLLCNELNRNSIKFCYIKSHSGVELNDSVDLLAKEAMIIRNEEIIKINMNFKRAKGIIKNDLYQCWLGEAKSLVSEWSSNFVEIMNLVEINDFYTSQFILAHGCFNSYKFRFRIGNTDSPNCYFGDRIDDPKHVLFHCIEFSYLRTTYLHKNNICNIKDLIKFNDVKIVSDFKKFCKLAIGRKLLSNFN